MKHKNNKNYKSQKTKFKPGLKKRENKCIVTFDEKDRQDYLTGFHKRKVERRKAAVEEIKRKIKEEQIKVREERHKEYLKMLKERKEALDDDDDKDDLEDVITATKESVQYDHPNHTVTVTTICDLDLTGSHLLGPRSDQVDEERDEERNAEVEEKKPAMPKKAGNPILNKKIRSLTASLNTFTAKRKKKGKQKGTGRAADKKVYETERKSKGGRTTKRERRRRTGRNETLKMQN